MSGQALDDSLGRLADDLAAMEADVYGIAALGREIAGIIDAQQRAARARLHTTIAAAMLFAFTSATSAAIGLDNTVPGAIVIGVTAGLAAGSSALVTGPASLFPSHVRARIRAWWRP